MDASLTLKKEKDMSGKKINKPWCVFLYGWPGGIGKIVEESKSVAFLMYCEGQHYSPEPWDTKYLWRFANITNAVKKFHKSTKCNLEQLKQQMIAYFPSEKNEIERIK